MSSIVSQALDGYKSMLEKADPRVENWFMMQSPLPSLMICLAYFVFVWISPMLMKDRKPMELRQVLIIYNLAMVALSSYTFYEFLMSGWLAGYSLGCQPVDYSNSPQAVRVFFILRKKNNQVSFLHVFHHGIMPFSWWFGVKLVPGGFGTFHSLLNSFIHLMMYTYYGLSAMGPAFHKYLWWKKYMTKMQIVRITSKI
ncbi:elongation of very long chain fatty acids protein [Elysia marginata]|uniref:Elongation of very long chain fatty acids protein n=1 Tax=Elysia marginata TaxID=1093978 RepID=A0AAV4HY63_9GAST|nr:elongation of very long chain fatty acids protein [Elysia marginata]